MKETDRFLEVGVWSQNFLKENTYDSLSMMYTYPSNETKLEQSMYLSEERTGKKEYQKKKKIGQGTC